MQRISCLLRLTLLPILSFMIVWFIWQHPKQINSFEMNGMGIFFLFVSFKSCKTLAHLNSFQSRGAFSSRLSHYSSIFVKFNNLRLCERTYKKMNWKQLHMVLFTLCVCVCREQQRLACNGTSSSSNGNEKVSLIILCEHHESFK